MIRSLAAASLSAAATVALSVTPVLAGAPASAAAAPTSGALVAQLHGLHPGGRGATETSENWSGYIRSGASGAYHTSTASWTVPTLSTKYNGYSSTWVGIDGASSGDNYLIQTGTEADVIGGKTHYDAWWEIITPSNEAPETLYGNLPVHPGDAITASVTKGASSKWTLKLTDTTDGASGTHTATYNGPGKSAEWIQEDTDVNNEISAAPDWHSVTFHGITVNGANGDISAGASVNIVDGTGVQEDSTGAPNSSNNGFTVTWLAHGSPTPIF